jgi:hypothetical protein
MNKPSKCITVQEARDLQDNWVTTRGVSIQNTRGEEDIGLVSADKKAMTNAYIVPVFFDFQIRLSCLLF